MAERTTTGRLDANFCIIPATCLIRSALATEEPPNFITIMSSPHYHIYSEDAKVLHKYTKYSEEIQDALAASLPKMLQYLHEID
jgi:hypothetical protein